MIAPYILFAVAIALLILNLFSYIKERNFSPQQKIRLRVALIFIVVGVILLFVIH